MDMAETTDHGSIGAPGETTQSPDADQTDATSESRTGGG